jgi:hypothetical protein
MAMTTTMLDEVRSPSPAPRHKPLAWQGWTLSIPAYWNPLKLEGDFDCGSLLIGDLNGPRLALRWATPHEKKFDPDAWSRRAIADEGGGADAKPRDIAGWNGVREWSDSESPDRKVWVGFSSISRRVLQIVGRNSDHPADSSRDAALDWSVFDLSCRTPREWRLSEQRLNAGDLMLAFSRGRERMCIRQVALAHLALKRMPIARWLDKQAARHRQHYRAIGNAEPISIASRDGLSTRLTRRRRFCWSRNVPPELTLLALHDQTRDRLVLLEAADATIAEEFCRSVGSSVTVPPASAGGARAAAKPLRLQTATFSANPTGGALLRVPLQPRWPFRFPTGASKTFELDELGRLVWEHCNGQHTLAQIITALAERYRLNLREAEVATTTFLRTLASRGLITVEALEPERA